MSIGERIKKARELRGMSQEELTKKAGFISWGVMSLEKGLIHPEIHHVIILCDALNVTADWLLGRTDDIEPNTNAPESKS